MSRRLVKRGPLAAQVPAKWMAIALDEGGDELNSVVFARWIGAQQRAGIGGLAFLIGDAAGFEPGDLDGVSRRISLSRLTLPHQLCFVIVAEQLYRASSILRGEPYHRS